MSKLKSKIKNQKSKIEQSVMEKVEIGEIKMKPRWIFVLGSFLTIVSIAGLTFAATFFVNVTIFLIRKRGPGYGRIDMVLDSFPLWIPLFAIVGIVLGIRLLKKYDFSYRKNSLLVAILFIVSVIIAGLIMDATGLNEIWSRRGPIRGFYQRYNIQENVLPWHEGQGRINKR